MCGIPCPTSAPVPSLLDISLEEARQLEKAGLVEPLLRGQVDILSLHLAYLTFGN